MPTVREPLGLLPYCRVCIVCRVKRPRPQRPLVCCEFDWTMQEGRDSGVVESNGSEMEGSASEARGRSSRQEGKEGCH